MKSAEHSYAKQLIFDALHRDRDRLTLDAVSKMQADDWDFLANIAKVHRLGPMLHDRLARFADAVPQMVRDRLKASQRNHAMRNLKIYRELVNVTRLLNDANIPSIALKGAYLARFAYPDPGLRPMRDLDLLIKPEQVIEAFELFKAHGYSTEHDGLPEAHFVERRHLPPLVGADGVNIELHHQLTAPSPYIPHPSDFIESVWRRATAKPIGGIPIAFLCPEDLLLHLCIHATHGHRLNVGPLALSDVAFLIETHQINWHDFIRIIEGGNWQRCVLPLLYLTKRHIGADFPEEVFKVFGERQCDLDWQKNVEYLLFSDSEDHHVLDFNVQDVLYSRSFFTKLKVLLGIVFPSRTVISLHSPVSAASPRVFLYYPMRWHRLLSQKLPPLIRALAGQKKSLRELAKHRKILDEWLHQDTGGAK